MFSPSSNLENFEIMKWNKLGQEPNYDVEAQSSWSPPGYIQTWSGSALRFWNQEFWIHACRLGYIYAPEQDSALRLWNEHSQLQRLFGIFYAASIAVTLSRRKTTILLSRLSRHGYLWINMYYGPRRNKTCLQGFQQSETQTSLPSNREKIETKLVASLDIKLSKKRCPGWSAPLLFANTRRQVVLRRCPYGVKVFHREVAVRRATQDKPF